MNAPLSFDQEPSALPIDRKQRHEELVDLFGRFIFWLRNSSLRAARDLIESEESRSALGTIRRRYYDGVAQMAPKEREAALLLAEETLDGFLERFLWCVGDEGVDARFGSHHAYRYRIEMEIVDVASEQVIEVETINRNGRFFGKYWGRWLNRFRDK